MKRLLLFTKDDSPIGELAQGDVVACVRTEELNGENSLDIGTTRGLEKGWRVLVEDYTGTWREYVVEGIDATHQDGGKAIGRYHATSSMQHDLSGVTVSKMPGVKTKVSASSALTDALSGTKRWASGDVTQTTTGGASMYQITAYEALGVLTEVWGGEVVPRITVDKKGVISRKVDLLSQAGKRTVTRRFDYGSDVRSISRRVDQEPTVCRIIPRGKGLETEDGGIERKLTIESVNQGRNYLENSATAQLVRLPNGSGGWEYPTMYVDYPSIEDESELKAQAQRDLDYYTTPKVTYEASVVQLSQAGMDAKGIALGDDVHCVDRKFMEDGLRVQGRVTKLVTNELDESDVAVTIGYLTEDVGSILAKRFASMRTSLNRFSAIQTFLETENQSTKEYLDNIIDHLNEEINATGGYTYITQGQGLRTYDKAVSDPLVGAEASQVVEIKGGSIRIANSRTSSGDWNWRSVFTAGHIAADMITAAHITSGYIGNASGNFFVNLDNGTTVLKNATFTNCTATNATFTDCSAVRLTADKSTFTDCQATDLYAHDSRFSNCTAFDLDVHGGTIEVTQRNGSKSVAMNNGRFEVRDGGATSAFIYSNNVTTYIEPAGSSIFVVIDSRDTCIRTSNSNHAIGVDGWYGAYYIHNGTKHYFVDPNG